MVGQESGCIQIDGNMRMAVSCEILRDDLTATSMLAQVVKFGDWPYEYVCKCLVSSFSFLLGIDRSVPT